MKPQLTTGRLLAGGFLVIAALLVVLAIGADRVAGALAGLTSNMFRHPFTVSNAVLEANSDIIAMHRHMKDVALATTSEELELAISRVNEDEREVYRHFDVVMERFLGDKTEITKAREAFSNWKPIRSEVVKLTRAGRTLEAVAITKGRGAEYVVLLTEHMDGLIDFSRRKANEFHANSEAQRSRSRLILYGLMTAILLAGGGVAWFVIAGVRRSERATMESEKRFKGFTEMASDWYWETDENLRFTYISRGASQHGLEPELIIGTTLEEGRSDIFHYADFDDELPALKARKPYRNIERPATAIPNQWINVSGIPQFDEHGLFHGYYGVSRNITERKRTEQTLRESEERFRLLVEMSPESILISSVDGEVQFANPAALKLFGAASSEDLVGLKLLDLTHPDYHDIVKQRLRKGVVRGTVLPTSTLKYLRVDGSEFDGEGTLGYTTWNGRDALQGVVRDVTERKQVVEALEESERQFRTVTNAAPAAINYADRDEKFRFVNKTYAGWHDMETEEIIGKTFLELVGTEA